ncbi:MAG TPA: PilZ domain-containing protein [Pirellulaceae bacterium]|nr:PilZ domain-containing protein [Pirellulaceae bacterium]
MLTSLDPALWPSPALLAFAKRQAAQQQLHLGAERRAEERLLYAMPVVTYGVDEHIRPVADPQAMVVRDHSAKGLGLVYERPFSHRKIVVELTYPEEGKFLAAEVLWSKPLGPFYLLGCEIIAKLDAFPAARTLTA